MRWLSPRTGAWPGKARCNWRRRPSPWAPKTRSYGALEAIRAFESRSGEAEARLGTNSPGVLGAALMRAKRQVYADRARLLGGLRLWPRGRFFVGGEDIYPRLIG